MLVLFFSPLSQPSRAVFWYLTINEIPFEAKRTDFNAMRTPEYLAMNPHHTMPLIKDTDGTVVFESNAIIFYLREKYGDKAGLYPAAGDLHERTQLQQVLSWYPTSFRWQLVQYIFNVVVGPARFGMPKPSEERSKDMFEKLLNAVKTLNDTWLSKPGHVVGNKLSIADLQLFSEIEQLRMVPNFDWTPYANIQRYRELMRKAPHYDAVFAGLLEMTGAKP